MFAYGTEFVLNELDGRHWYMYMRCPSGLQPSELMACPNEIVFGEVPVRIQNLALDTLMSYHCFKLYAIFGVRIAQHVGLENIDTAESKKARSARKAT